MQARSKQCMIGPAEINMRLPDGGLGGAASPPAGSHAPGAKLILEKI